jgi:hypothetical protein
MKKSMNVSMKFVFILCLLFPLTAFAIVGEETALMIQLVTTTASQLNELEKLVTNTEKYTKKMQQYNELSQDQYFRAERVLYLAEELSSKKEVANLGDLNIAIRDLKYNMGDFKELMKNYAEIKSDEKKTSVYVEKNKKLNDMEKKRAELQVAHSIDAKNVGSANQLTAQNTALIYENQLKQSEIQLELLKTQKTANRLKAEELEDKRLEEMERLRFYGRGHRGNLGSDK